MSAQGDALLGVATRPTGVCSRGSIGMKGSKTRRPSARGRKAEAPITKAQGARIIRLFTKISDQFEELKAIARRRAA